MWKRRVVFLSLVLFFSSCKNKKVINEPFYYTEGLTCDDLFAEGYKWVPGVDVTLIGKKIGDTIIHYQIYQKLEPIKYEDYDVEELNEIIEPENEQELDVSQYLEQDPLTLSDSIYNLVWGDTKKQQKNFCNNSKVIWRNFILKIDDLDIEKIINDIIIKKDSFEIINHKEDKSDYTLENFELINTVKKDTFNCSIYKRDGEFYFSSSVKIK